MNVKQCPNCKKYNAKYCEKEPEASDCKTEIKLAAYCPECGYI